MIANACWSWTASAGRQQQGRGDVHGKLRPVAEQVQGERQHRAEVGVILHDQDAQGKVRS